MKTKHIKKRLVPDFSDVVDDLIFAKQEISSLSLKLAKAVEKVDEFRYDSSNGCSWNSEVSAHGRNVWIETIGPDWDVWRKQRLDHLVEDFVRDHHVGDTPDEDFIAQATVMAKELRRLAGLIEFKIKISKEALKPK